MLRRFIDFIKNCSFEFLNAIEFFLFRKHITDKYIPVGGRIGRIALLGTIAALLLAMVSEATAANTTVTQIVLGVVFGIAFIIAMYKTYLAINELSSTPIKIGVIFYSAALFLTLSLIFIKLMVWAIIIIVGYYTIRFIWRYMTGCYEADQIAVTNQDGSRTKMKKTGGSMSGATYEKE